MKSNMPLCLKQSFSLALLVVSFTSVQAQNKKNNDDLMGRSYIIKSGKHEVWTPQNNPITKASGSKEASVMLVENIVIQPGGSLNISDLVLKMSTKGRINVYSSTSKKPDGKLVLSNVTITSRLNLHPWSGIRVLGYFTNTEDSIALSQKGIVTINSCNIVNADTTLAYISKHK